MGVSRYNALMDLQDMFDGVRWRLDNLAVKGESVLWHDASLRRL